MTGEFQVLFDAAKAEINSKENWSIDVDLANKISQISNECTAIEAVAYFYATYKKYANNSSALIEQLSNKFSDFIISNDLLTRSILEEIIVDPVLEDAFNKMGNEDIKNKIKDFKKSKVPTANMPENTINIPIAPNVEPETVQNLGPTPINNVPTPSGSNSGTQSHNHLVEPQINQGYYTTAYDQVASNRVNLGQTIDKINNDNLKASIEEFNNRPNIKRKVELNIEPVVREAEKTLNLGENEKAVINFVFADDMGDPRRKNEHRIVGVPKDKFNGLKSRVNGYLDWLEKVDLRYTPQKLEDEIPDRQNVVIITHGDAYNITCRMVNKMKDTFALGYGLASIVHGKLIDSRGGVKNAISDTFRKFKQKRNAKHQERNVRRTEIHNRLNELPDMAAQAVAEASARSASVTTNNNQQLIVGSLNDLRNRPVIARSGSPIPPGIYFNPPSLNSNNGFYNPNSGPSI